MPKPFWKIKNSAEDDQIGELLIYGDLSNSTWWGDEITPQLFNDDLDALDGVNELHVRINSYGGDVFAGHAILNSIKNFKRKNTCEIKVFIDGIAASAASVVAMAGDKIIMPSNTMMMIHDPMIGVCGYLNEAKLNKYLEAIGPIKDSIIAAYHERTGIDKKAISETMVNETWMTAETAIELGYADVLSDEIELDVQMKSNDILQINNYEIDCTQFKNMPMQFINMAVKPKNQPEVQKKPVETTEEEEIMNKEDLKNKHLDIYNEVLNEGIEAERTRIKNIEEIATPGSEKLVNAAKFETPIDSGELAKQILSADNAARKTVLDAVKADAETLEEVDPAKNDVGTEDENIDEEVKNMVSLFDED